MTPRPTRLTRAKHGGRKLSIEERLLAAMERLLEGGNKFATLSVEQLASEAGMARGTFYLHFKDKGELVSRLMGVVTDEIVESSGAWLAFAEKPQRKDIEAALIGVAATFKKHRTIISALNDTAHYDETVAAQYQKMMDTICTRCRHSVAAAKRSGIARSRASDAVADALSWFVVLYFGRFSAMVDGAEFSRLVEAVTHICATAVFRDDV